MIELKDISKTYQMGEATINALSGIDLTVVEGEFVAIVGPSGSGKSTLVGWFCRDYGVRHPDDFLFSHFVGASTGSMDL